MCGICGYLSKSKYSKGRKIIKNMGDTLTHRGPDDTGYFIEDTIGLCHKRLSILDLSMKGHQPMEYKGRYIIVFNGEIYNYLELRDELKKEGYAFNTNTDTEVIPAAYERWGTECLQKFNGMWAFALWDKKKRTLFCARDRFGIKPFYYHVDKERFIFASEIKALLCDESIPRIANKSIVYDYLTQGLLEHTNETFFSGVFKLPAGHFILMDSTLEVEPQCYYDVTFSQKTKEKLLSEDKRLCRNIFESAVRLRLRADVSVGSCLSGGLDSSAIVCCMNELLKKEKGVKQHTFSFCTEERRIDERKYMRAVTDTTDVVPHQIFSDGSSLKQDLEELIYYQDEPFSSTGMYASYCVYRAAKKEGITVLLDGQGADEILCGYRKSRIYYVRKLLREKHFLSAVVELMTSVSQIKGSISIKKDFYKIKRILLRKQAETKKKYLNAEFARKEKGYGYPENEDFQHNDVYLVSLPALLRYADRNSMAFSIESRLPFLDYRFVEFCAALPIGKKLYHGWSKYVMRKSLILPEVIRKRKDKIGFATPEEEWLKKEKGYFQKIFKEDKVYSKAFINVNALLDNWDQNQGLFRYICLELWMRKFNVAADSQEVGI